MFSKKEEQYIELVKDIRDCRICQGIPAPPYCEEGERLVNDSHGMVPGQEIDINSIYANRWNLWQGSLDAEIMVIGLDFGKRDETGWRGEDQSSDPEWLPAWKSQTDKNLFRAFRKAFGEEFTLTRPCDKLFFTNVACCYREKRTSGEANEAWYAFCARRYLGRLIRIIEPELIICLGLRVFESLGCCEGARIVCTDARKPEGKMSLEELLDAREPYHFAVQIGDKRIDTAIVFHPGANRNRNRKEADDDGDWERVRRLYEQVKNRRL